MEIFVGAHPHFVFAIELEAWAVGRRLAGQRRLRELQDVNKYLRASAAAEARIWPMHEFPM